MGITFKEIGDDCELCPLHKEGCNGLINNGNGPVYPPCSEMDEDTDVEQYLMDRKERTRKAQEQREQIQKAKDLDAHRKTVKKQRRQYSDHYCHKEYFRVKALRNLIRQLDKGIDSVKFDLMFSEAMVEGGIIIGNTEKMKSSISSLEERQALARSALEEAQKQLLVKRKEAEGTEGYKSIR